MPGPSPGKVRGKSHYFLLILDLDRARSGQVFTSVVRGRSGARFLDSTRHDFV